MCQGFYIERLRHVFKRGADSPVAVDLHWLRYGDSITRLRLSSISATRRVFTLETLLICNRALFGYLHDVLPLTLDLLATTELCSDLAVHASILNMLADICRGKDHGVV